MEHLGSLIKQLIAERGLTAKELSKRINLSPTSLSKIVQGTTKPRQANLTRIIQELCQTPDEEQKLISAYAMAEELTEEKSQLDQATFQKIEEERVRRYLQAKAQSVAFRDSVELLLEEAKIPFESPHAKSDILCDFLIPGPPRIALECKANTSRDWDRTIASARILQAELPADEVLVVVPSPPTLTPSQLESTASLTVLSIGDLIEYLTSSSK